MIAASSIRFRSARSSAATLLPRFGVHGHRCQFHSLQECEFDGCDTTPLFGVHGHHCRAHSIQDCEVIDCDTTPQFGVHGHRCCTHSLHVPTIELLDDTLLAAIGRDSIKEDHSPTYAGLLGTSGQSEIDQDVRRLKDAGLITEKVAQYVTHVECDGSHMSAHDTARDAERLLIRLIGLDNLLNSRHGGGGRVPNDTRIGGVFISLCLIDK